MPSGRWSTVGTALWACCRSELTSSQNLNKENTISTQKVFLPSLSFPAGQFPLVLINGSQVTRHASLENKTLYIFVSCGKNVLDNKCLISHHNLFHLFIYRNLPELEHGNVECFNCRLLLLIVEPFGNCDAQQNSKCFLKLFFRKILQQNRKLFLSDLICESHCCITFISLDHRLCWNKLWPNWLPASCDNDSPILIPPPLTLCSGAARGSRAGSRLSCSERTGSSSAHRSWRH